MTVNSADIAGALGNAGAININASSLTITGGANSGSSSNSGTINVGSATPGSLAINNTAFNNSGGTLNVATGSLISQSNSQITGGTIATSGTGVLRADGNGGNFLSGVTLNGTLDLTSIGNSRERIANGIAVNGAVNIANGGILSVNGGTQTLGGTGAINLNDSSARLALEGNGTTTIDTGLVVRGQGNIGVPVFVGGTNNLVNNGLISADVNGATLSITPGAGSGSVTNNSTLQATGGGTLQLSNATINNGGGLINAQNGSVVLQTGSTISGGTIGTASSTGVFRADVNTANFLNGVTLNGTLDLTSIGNSRERVINGITLNGAVNVAGGGILSLDSANTAGNDQTVGGTGTINLNDGGARLALDGNGTTTIAAGITIHGQGNIGTAINAAGTNNLVNNGLISADVGGGTLSITPGGNVGNLTNNGTLQATAGGTLRLLNGLSVNNGNGTITAQNNSIVLQTNAVLIGGTIATAGSGVLQADGNGGNVLSGVTLNGTLDLTSIGNSRERVINGITLSGGAVNIANGGALSIDGTVTPTQAIGGTGTINLNGSATLALEGNGTTTIGANVVVRGQGNIGTPVLAGGINNLVNSGLISADVNSATLSITRGAGSGTVTNNSTLQATGGGTLQLNGVSVNNGGLINAQDGSVVLQTGSTVSGGTVGTASSTGVFRANGDSGNFLSGVTLNGTLDLSSIGNSRERVINGITLNGAVNVANGGILSLDSGNTSGSDQTVGGTGTINLNDGVARLALESNGTTTIGAGITIRGQGNIGTSNFAGGTNNLVNNGVISADVGAATLSITPGGGAGGVTNNNLIDARNGGTLRLNGVSVNNGSGLINAQNGSVVLQTGSTVSGGTVGTASSTGVFRADGNPANFLNGVTLNGTLDLTSIGNSRERVINGITLNGTVNVANGGILSLDSGNTSGSDQTVGGTGTINLNDGVARLALESNGTTTIAAGITIRGQGNIGTSNFAGGTNNLVNNGLISADVNGSTLSITRGGGSGTVTNNSTLQATGGGTLQLNGVSVNNGSGLINAQNGSVVLQTGSTVSGGTVGTANSTGVFRADGNTANFLIGVTLDGTLDLTSIGNSRERIANGITINGAVNIANSGILSVNGGAQTLGGSGTINLNDSGARLALESNGTTTIGANLVVRGQGNIGTPFIAGGTNNLINQGTITGDGGTLTITAGAGSGGFTNTGLVQAQNGTVTINPVLQGTGTLLISGTGQMNLSSAGANTTGTLTHNGVNAGSLNLGSQNLIVLTDYTNANFGVGNSFNQRANVTGPGQIVAGGNAAQAITGANITGGSTSNATLTIGNVHVGANTFAYQIANTGTTGPALRGAIQTNVNGANLTDGRLSGTGVTPSNYNTGAPGSNTGDLNVVFNASSAGALAPLSGQVLNLRSNFANIADQKLNIVLGTNAAAYNLAAGNATPSPVTIANQRIGGTGGQTLTVTNTAPSGGFTEGLNASFGTNTGAATNNGGSINLLAGGGNNGSAMSVGVNTATAGGKSGSVTLNYVSDGSGTSGLGLTNAGSQTINVSGNVYQVASGVINTAALNFGTVQVGQSVSQVLSISNNATGPNGFVEDLNARFGASTGTGAAQIGGSGSITGLAAGGTNTTAMTVTVNTGTAGNINGAIAVNFFSAGSVGGVSNGLGELGVGSQSYGVQGLIQANVINTASPVINNSPINLGNVRVGAASPTAFVSVTNQATTAPQAALNASISGNAPITASGGFNLLLPGQTNNNSLQVGMATAAAGAINGTATIAFVSDASNVGNCAPNCQLHLQSQNVTVTGGVYQVAQPNVPANVNLGNFRIGNAPSQAIAISNTSAAPSGFQEGLDAGIASTGGKATGTGGPITNLAQGASSNAISVGINNATATAGANTGTVTLNLASNGSTTSGLTTLNLAQQTINVSGTGYNAAAGSATPSPITIANQRIGGTGSQTLTIANTAAASAFSEDLNASFGANSGNATSTGSIAGRLAGTNNTGTGTMSVGVDTSAAGARSGTVTVNYQTAGAVSGVSNGLGTASAGSQIINVSGNVYQLAAGQIQTAPLNFGTVQVGQTVSQNLVIRNTAAGPAGFVEDLNAAFGSSTDSRIIGTGALNGILAGSNSTGANGTMNVSINTAAAGTVNGSIRVNYTSAGAVNDVGNGLGTLGVGFEDYAAAGTIVQGNVVDQAKPVINGVANPGTVTVNLGNVRINTAANQSLAVLNQATGNQQAALNGSIASNGAPVNASGSFNLLAPGATSNALSVGIDTSAAGARSGSATVSLVSDASNIGGCGGNCQLALPSQTVNVNANVYRLANPTLNTGAVTIAARVGDAVGATQAVSITNASPDLFTEGLKVGITGVSGNAQHNSGAIANLAAQGNDASTIRVGLASTATAGTTSGQVQLGFTSTGAGTTNAADIGVGAGTVTVTGHVYTTAQANVANPSISFGIVHVGDAVGPIALNVSNTANSTALNDTLKASFGAVSGPFSGTGAISGLAAGASDSSTMKVGLNTSAAGVYNGSGSVALASHNSEMADLALTPTALIMSAQVNNYANPVFTKTGGVGSLTRSGNTFSLDLGDLILGTGTTSANLGVLNDVLGPADLVDGSFDVSGANDFALTGFNSFANLDAADLFDGLMASLIASSLGSFDDTIVLNAFAHNASGFNQQLTLTLLLHADVVQQSAVPEPPVLALLLIALAGSGLALRLGRRARGHR